MEGEVASLHSLIAKLCEKYKDRCRSRRITLNDAKSLRSKCYEILLYRNATQIQEDDLENNTDPVCHLLAWQYQLITRHNLPEHAENLRLCCDKLQQLNVFNNPAYTNLIMLLLKLRRVPAEEDSIMDRTICKYSIDRINFDAPSTFTYFDDSKFVLPKDENCNVEVFEANRFKLHNKRATHKAMALKYFNSLKGENECFAISNENQCRPSLKVQEDDNIWEIAARSPPGKYRTWEEYGCTTPTKELPFLCECGSSSTTYLHSLSSQLDNLLVTNMDSKHTTLLVMHSQFVKDVKYLLVGMESKTFTYNAKNELALVPGTYVEGVTPGAMESYCKDLIFCGNCCKELNTLCNNYPSVGSNKNLGFIFNELLESVKSYLSYYRIAIFSISDNTNLLLLHSSIKQLCNYTVILAKICKVGPFKESTRLPYGVALLNYLYHQALEVANTTTSMILYSILYPCYQVYFMRFLQRWILEGTVQDPYGEFFINVHVKYVTTRGRTYWTRSYTIREDLVPDFITDCGADILFCGKAMNLLKVCVPKSTLCLYLMDKQLDVISCCLTTEQVSTLEQNNSQYYLEVTTLCGPRISLARVIGMSKEANMEFLNLVAKKRVVTLSRIELERKKKIEMELEKKQSQMSFLKEQYEEAAKLKLLKEAEEIEVNIKLMERDLQTQLLRNKIIEEESKYLVEYYNKLYEAAEARRLHFKNRISELKNSSNEIVPKEMPDIVIEEKDSEHSSECSFVSTCEEVVETKSDYMLASDLINANSIEIGVQTNTNDNFEVAQNNNVLENVTAPELTEAQKNKLKVMSSEFGINTGNDTLENVSTPELTEAQKNKLKVMSSEFGIDISNIKYVNTNRSLTTLQVNRNKVLGSNLFFEHAELVKNSRNNNINENWSKNKQNTLSLDFSKINKVNETKPSPMSINSTPLSSIITPIDKSVLSLDKIDSQTTGEIATATSYADSCFVFEIDKAKDVLQFEERKSMFNLEGFESTLKDFPATNVVSAHCLNLYLQQSIRIPLITQTKLVTNELLKYYINDLQYFNHLNNLRNYFFLLDGEFGRNICENLFKKLYDVNFAIDLINGRTLQVLVYKALDYSTKLQNNSQGLSFSINNLPKKFDLQDPDVLDCISLTYKTTWPLNILLPSDTIAKYDEVFKFLMKLHRVSWVLQNIFQGLGLLEKKTKLILKLSPQYCRLHQCRHIMTHFIQTLQSYVIGEVLHTSWETFMKNLESVVSFEQIYTFHTIYIKNILFMCLLNQKSAPLKNVLHKIFIVILKFYYYLETPSWQIVNGTFTHPNFKRLQDVFNNFENLVLYLFKIANKVVKSGYQPHLMQLLDMLNVNEYYTKKNVKNSVVQGVNVKNVAC